MESRKKTYLFYDIETTGLNKCFDQIIQFAAVRTDQTLNELEHHEIQVRLNPDVIPSPSAIITHRIGIDQMLLGKSEIEAIQEIHQLMNTPGTISVGYNTLGFDDEFLRFSFYRNLLAPYTHQFDNQCSRMDLYPITALYYLFKPTLLKWPNPPNLKLENLSKANRLAEGQAHNAMIDVNACLTLARKYMTDEPMWRYAIGYFNRKTDINRSLQSPVAIQSKFYAYREGLLVQGSFGLELFYQAPVISLGQHQHYKNQFLWLCLDREELSSTTPENIAKMTYVIRKKMGEQPIVLPAFDRYLKYLSPERLQLANKNKRWLQQHPHLFQNICDYHQNLTYPKVPQIDPDAALYESGFPTSYEEFLFKRFHLVPPTEKEKIASEFPNAIRREQALRLIGRHYLGHLSEENQKIFSNYLKCLEGNTENLRFNYRGQCRFTRDAAIKEIEQLKKEKKLDSMQMGLLDDLNLYLCSAKNG